MLKSYQKGYEIKVNHLYALHAVSTQYVCIPIVYELVHMHIETLIGPQHMGQ